MTGAAIFLLGMAAGMVLMALPVIFDKGRCPVCMRHHDSGCTGRHR